MEARYGKDTVSPITLPYTGRVYLGTLTKGDRSIDTLFWLDLPKHATPGDRYIAIDVGARDGHRSDAERGVFMVVQPPAGSHIVDSDLHLALHKLGITSSVPLFEKSNSDLAAQRNGLVLDTPKQWYYIGGDSCKICHPRA
jgi:hypothetical protein